MKHIQSWGLTAAIGALAFAGCGEDAVDTGVPPNRVLDAATPEEFTAICEEISGELVTLWAGEWSELTCTALGVALDSELLGSCTEISMSCNEDIGALEPSNCDSVSTAAFDACDTTVGELEACANAIRARVVELHSQVSCNTTREELGELDTEVNPAICQRIAAECPAVNMFISVQLPSVSEE